MGGSRTNMRLTVFLGKPSVHRLYSYAPWLMEHNFDSRCTPSRTSVHTRTFANSRLSPWVTQTYSYTSVITCAYKLPPVDGSLLWSLALLGLAISCSAFLAVSP